MKSEARGVAAYRGRNAWCSCTEDVVLWMVTITRLAVPKDTRHSRHWLCPRLGAALDPSDFEPRVNECVRKSRTSAAAALKTSASSPSPYPSSPSSSSWSRHGRSGDTPARAQGAAIRRGSVPHGSTSPSSSRSSPLPRVSATIKIDGGSRSQGLRALCVR